MAQREKTSRKSRFPRRAVLAVLLIALLLLVAGGVLFSTRITDIQVEGNSHYTKEEVVDMLFPGERDRITALCWWEHRFGEQEDIPFVETYEMNFTGLHSVEIILYEKSIVGCIEYMGSFMYFDKDGIVVESSPTHEENIPLITGLTFERIVLYQKLPVPREDVFEDILNLTQLLSLHEVPVNQIYFDSQNQATLTLANVFDGETAVWNLAGVKVLLGDRQNMEEKIAELASQLASLQDLSGTLHLENYSPGAINPRYIFEKE